MSQQTKTFIIAIGPATTRDGTVSPAEFDSLIYKTYLSIGYKILEVQNLGEAIGEDRQATGHKFLFILVRDYEEKKVIEKQEKKDDPSKTLETKEVIDPK